MNWAAGLRATMSTEEKVRDAASAQTLKAEHEALKGEIEAREENFSSVLDLGEAMVQTGHYAAMVRNPFIVRSFIVHVISRSERHLIREYSLITTLYFSGCRRKMQPTLGRATKVAYRLAAEKSAFGSIDRLALLFARCQTA